MTILLEEYKRLSEHIGFIGGSDDPVFLQDKIRYLQSQCPDDYLPTYKIDMPIYIDDVMAISYGTLIGLERYF